MIHKKFGFKYFTAIEAKEGLYKAKILVRQQIPRKSAVTVTNQLWNDRLYNLSRYRIKESVENFTVLPNKDILKNMKYADRVSLEIEP